MWFSIVMILLCSCSVVEKIGVRTTTPMLKNASKEMETETQWNLFKEALPANLKTMEGLLFLDPENSDLLLSLLKAYGALAFGVEETLYLEESLSQIEDGQHLAMTKAYYQRAIVYGQRYFSEHGIEYSDLMTRNRESLENFKKFLDEKLDSDNHDHIEAAFFLAQSLGGLINVDRGNFSLMSQLPLVKSLFDWSCGHNEKLNFGACQIFYGGYFSGRPKTLGGDEVKGKSAFLKGFKDFPDNYLIRISYLQYYVLPRLDQKEFNVQKEFLINAFNIWEKTNQWDIDKTPVIIKPDSARVNLLNAIAKKRFEILLQHERNLF